MAYEDEVFPWLKHLGEDGQREFFEEIQQISVISHELGTPLSDYVERLNTCVAAWKATAEVCSDPELKRILTTDQGFNEEDFVEVPRPEAPGDCCRELSDQCRCTDSDCCLERSVCDHGDVAAERPKLPQRVRAPRKLCPMNIPHEEKADTARWCNLTAGHTGLHRDREGVTWNNGDARRARSLEEFPEPRHGE